MTEADQPGYRYISSMSDDRYARMPYQSSSKPIHFSLLVSLLLMNAALRGLLG